LKNSFLDWEIIFFSKYLPYILILSFLGFLLAEHGRRRRLFIFIEAALAILVSRGLVTEGIRFFHHVARPFEVWQVIPLVPETLGNSFPSGHATFYFALATVLFLRNRKWGIWFFIFAIINGFARIAAGVHWPMDVVGGAAIGIASAGIIHLLLRRSSEELMLSDMPSASPREVESDLPAQEKNTL